MPKTPRVPGLLIVLIPLVMAVQGCTIDIGPTSAMAAEALPTVQLGSTSTSATQASVTPLTESFTTSFLPASSSTSASTGSSTAGSTTGSTSGTTTGSTASAPKDERTALIDSALQIAGVPVTTENEQAVNTIVENESQWDPNVTNRTDKNAKAGNPSCGLMQTTVKTFKAYALSGYNKNIYDPLSNLIAGIRYAMDRYDSLQNVPGVKSIARGGDYVPY